MGAKGEQDYGTTDIGLQARRRRAERNSNALSVISKLSAKGYGRSGKRGLQDHGTTGPRDGAAELRGDVGTLRSLLR
jgi:hypothetical protein